MKRVRGFTLIELLIVTSIVSLISTVTLASVTSARDKAGEAQKARIVAELRTALELFYDANGYFPSSGTAGDTLSYCITTNPSVCVYGSSMSTVLIDQIETFLPNLPAKVSAVNMWGSMREDMTYQCNEYFTSGPYSGKCKKFTVAWSQVGNKCVGETPAQESPPPGSGRYFCYMTRTI